MARQLARSRAGKAKLSVTKKTPVKKTTIKKTTPGNKTTKPGRGQPRRGGGSVVVYARCDRVVAHLAGVKGAVWAETLSIGREAEALFAAHDRPGGHEVGTAKGRLDGFVFLEGPAPLSVEFGHWAHRGEHPQGPPVFVEGLHILGRAAVL